jgi:hypothetical protein
MLFSFISEIPSTIQVSREVKGILNFYKPHPVYLKHHSFKVGSFNYANDHVNKKLKQGETSHTVVESKLAKEPENALGEPIRPKNQQSEGRPAGRTLLKKRSFGSLDTEASTDGSDCSSVDLELKPEYFATKTIDQLTPFDW